MPSGLARLELVLDLSPAAAGRGVRVPGFVNREAADQGVLHHFECIVSHVALETLRSTLVDDDRREGFFAVCGKCERFAIGTASRAGQNQKQLGRVIAIRIFEKGAGQQPVDAQSHRFVHGFQTFWLKDDVVFSRRVWRGDVDGESLGLKNLIERSSHTGQRTSDRE